MPRGHDVFVTQLKQEIDRTVALLRREIEQRETELARLVAQANLCRAAIGTSGARTRRGTSPARSPGSSVKRIGSRLGGRGSQRVDWDEVLASVPATFGIADVMNHPGARAKGRAQVYPALSRWQQAKKIKKVGTGRYQRV